MAAEDIEQFVVSHIKKLLQDPKITADTLNQTQIDEGQAFDMLKRIDDLWHSLFPKEQQAICQIMIKTAWITPEGLDLHFHKDAINQLLCYSGLQTIGENHENN